MAADLIVCGRYLLTQDKARNIIEHGSVAISGDTIIETGPAATLAQKYPAATVIAEAHGLIMPGLINIRAHLIADPTRPPNPQDLILSMTAMIRTGTTSFRAGFPEGAQLTETAKKIGLRAWFTEAGEFTGENDPDLFFEMKKTALLHKILAMDPTVMPADSVLDSVTIGGACELGAEKIIGSLEAGKKADIIVLDLDQPHLTPMYNIISHLIYAARGSDVIHSIINGRMVMRDRRLNTMDDVNLAAKNI